MNANKHDAGGLLSCPFCGSSTAPIMSNTDVLSRRKSFMHTVVCDANQGGCGATGGFERFESQAIEGWNRRNGEQCRAASVDGEDLARAFHEAYERLAPQFGYETREETRQFDPASKNGRLMIAVCNEIRALSHGVPEGMVLVPLDVALDAVSEIGWANYRERISEQRSRLYKAAISRVAGGVDL